MHPFAINHILPDTGVTLWGKKNPLKTTASMECTLQWKETENMHNNIYHMYHSDKSNGQNQVDEGH